MFVLTYFFAFLHINPIGNNLILGKEVGDNEMSNEAFKTNYIRSLSPATSPKSQWASLVRLKYMPRQ